MRLVKTEAAKKSYALYGLGARAGQYAIVDEQGALLYRIEGQVGHAGVRGFSMYPANGDRAVFAGKLRSCLPFARSLASRGA